MSHDRALWRTRLYAPQQNVGIDLALLLFDELFAVAVETPRPAREEGSR